MGPGAGPLASSEEGVSLEVVDPPPPPVDGGVEAASYNEIETVDLLSVQGVLGEAQTDR